jgi:peptidoglycan L-alanyl-D-glutamate endopeptidase CwlK
MSNFKFGAKSEERLQGVHPDLVKVVRRALELSKVDFSVSEELRTYARQKELFEAGKSKTMNSRHLSGHAVDLYPVSKAGADWTPEDFVEVVDAMRRASKALGIPLTHGADWGWDHPHHELQRLAYP